MPKAIFFIINLILLSLIPLNILSQGVQFKGNECLINDRTSYNVFDKISPKFSDQLNISFEISFRETSRIGYILRIKNEEAQTIYNLSVDNRDVNYVNFKFNEEGKSKLIEVNIEKIKLEEYQWSKIDIRFNLKEDSLLLVINEERASISNLNLPKSWYPIIFFGKSEHVIDVPSFAIRNLTVRDNKQKYEFPLNESESEIVHDSKGKSIGHVENPIWLINDAYYWKHLTTFKSQTVAGTNFNVDAQEIYYFNQDSIVIYNVRTGTSISRKYTNKCPMTLNLGTNYLDREGKRLVVYEVYDEHKINNVNIAYLDLKTYTWSPVCNDLLPIQLHHHGGYYDEKKGEYTIFGGFGNLTYNKEFYTFNNHNQEWSKLSVQGDRIDPRYFVSMGYLGETSSIYLLGGMGNESGDQTVGRRYYYDLYQLNMDSLKITKLWEIDWTKDNIVPTRGMVIPNDSTIYTLCYPEHFSDSFLKLYKFSIKDGTYQILGDSISIHSEKIKTNANIYYNEKLNELYAIVQEFEDDDIVSDVKIYSLAFPPITRKELVTYPQESTSKNIWLWLLLPIVLLTAVGLYFSKRRKKKSTNSKVIVPPVSINNESLPLLQEKQQANAIYLFGDFSVRNRHNKEITYMFSTKLKHAFLMILHYTFKGGISSQQLSEILWPNKPENKVKNSRGVTLNHLRKILSELDGINLIHEKGVFKIVFSENCYCDCVKCLDIIESVEIGENSQTLSRILSRGKFLGSINLPMFDNFKELIEGKVEPFLLIEMKNSFNQNNYKQTILLAEAMFNIDPINDSAIYYLILSMVKINLIEEARKRYIIFITEYRKTMGEEYPRLFTELSE